MSTHKAKPKKKTGEISKEVLLALEPTLVTLQHLLNGINSKLKALNNKVDKLRPEPMPAGSREIAPGVFIVPCADEEP